MSINNLNPWEMGSELDSGPQIPSFAKTEYMIVSIKPPKGKTVRDGLVLTAIMVSYINAEGEKVKTVEVTEDGTKYTIQFPQGKRNLIGTKYRGPKSIYKFVSPKTKKFYQIDNIKFTPGYAESFLSETQEGWDKKTPEEQDVLIDQYLEDMFMFGFSNDLALNDENQGEEIIEPKIGMTTELYRMWTPPDRTKGETYGKTIITKFAPREGKVNLSGTFELVDETVAVMVHHKYQERNDSPSSDSDLPF